MVLALTSLGVDPGIERLLRRFGGDPNYHRHNAMDSPLHLCIQRCSFDYGGADLLRDCLLAGGIDLYQKSASHHESPLAHAVRLGYPSVVSCLLHHGVLIERSLPLPPPAADGQTWQRRHAAELIQDMLQRAARLQRFLA